MGETIEMTPPETVGTDEIDDHETPEPSPARTQTSTPEKNKGGRPPKGKTKAESPKETNFFRLVQSVSAEDWGSNGRACIYVYIDEPVTIAKTWGETRYAKKLFRPIVDLEPIKELYGSCKGWLSLNIRKAAADVGDQTARHDFEIFDLQCPPKIPKKAWANDDRNTKWDAILPPEAPPQPAQPSLKDQLMDGINVYKTIRDDVKDELKPAAAQPAAAPAPVDPWTAAEKILNMRSENPMVEFVKAQLTTMSASMEAERTRQFQAAESSRQREHDLNQKLMDAKIEALKASNGSGKSLIDQVLEIAEKSETHPLIKKLFGGLFGAGDAIEHRPRMNGTLLFWKEAITEAAPMLQPLIVALSSKLQQGGPVIDVTPGGAPAVAGAPQDANAELLAFVQHVVTPSLVEYFEDEQATGGDYAANLDNMFSARSYGANGKQTRVEQLQSVGVMQIFTLYKSSAPLDVRTRLFKRGDQAFMKFVQEFCAWKSPDVEEPPAAKPAEPATPGIVDYDSDPEEKGANNS